MSEPAIRVEGISKRYRLGRKEQVSDTFGGAVAAWLKAPFSNLKTLKGLSHFETGSSEADDVIWALKDISFEVNQGEVIGIIGRNGAGKSTLLKILSRITEPTSGRAVINGRVSSLLEVGTGFHQELTGRENIYLNGTILGMSKKEIDRKFDEIVAFSELEAFLDTPVKRYSSGMKVRLAFAVAAHLDPEILLIDEVLAVGDAIFQKKCIGKMNEVAGKGRTVFFVSHNMAVVRNLCQRSLLLEKGSIAMDALTDKCINKYLDQNMASSSVVEERDLENRLEGVRLNAESSLQLKQISIQDQDGVTRKTFYSDGKIGVSVVFVCLRPVKDMRVAIQIVDENNYPILMSQNLDDADVIANFFNLEAGRYKADCTLNENIFSNREYYLTVHLVLPGEEHITANKILGFDVIFRGYNHVRLRGNIQGQIRPLLEWTMKKESVA